MLPLTFHGPTTDPQPRSHLRDVGLGCSPFARHYWGNHSLFSFPLGTEMFHFPRFARPTLCIQVGVMRLYPHWVFPFGHLRINARLATPRSFSQPPTSFIAYQSQGIHHTPLVAYLPQSLVFPGTLTRPGLKVRDQDPGPRSSRRTRDSESPAWFRALRLEWFGR